MRLSNIQTKFRLTIPFDKPDLNNVSYTKEAVLNAFSLDSIKNVPILDMNDSQNPIGVITGSKIKVKNNLAIVDIDATIAFGGTNETVQLNADNVVVSYEIESLGISKP